MLLTTSYCWVCSELVVKCVGKRSNFFPKHVFLVIEASQTRFHWKIRASIEQRYLLPDASFSLAQSFSAGFPGLLYREKGKKREKSVREEKGKEREREDYYSTTEQNSPFLQSRGAGLHYCFRSPAARPKRAPHVHSASGARRRRALTLRRVESPQ